MIGKRRLRSHELGKFEEASYEMHLAPTRRVLIVYLILWWCCCAYGESCKTSHV